MKINLTDDAVSEIKRVMEEQKMSPEENVLAVNVVGGGCSGFQYQLGFKEKKEVDSLNETTFNFDGIDASVENRSLPFLEGTTIDFYKGLDQRGFKFDNPNATGGCGCGKSFQA